MSASISSDCNEVKERYDSCFLKWYSEKFLRGTAKEDECDPLFKQYKTCITKALKDRGIDTMIEEARADNKENDMEFMKGTRCEGPTHRKAVAQSTDTLSVGDQQSQSRPKPSMQSLGDLRRPRKSCHSPLMCDEPHAPRPPDDDWRCSLSAAEVGPGTASRRHLLKIPALQQRADRNSR
ncbi:Mitochondrial distribution and morphology protein 35 [Oleoguttula sp. CCFEE 5521]